MYVHDGRLTKGILFITVIVTVVTLGIRSSLNPVNRKDERGYALLHYAAARGSIQDIALLLRRGANPNIRDADGNTPLHTAVSTGRIAAVAVLLRGGARVHARNRAKQSPLDLAVRRQGAKPLEWSIPLRTLAPGLPSFRWAPSAHVSPFDDEYDRQKKEIERLEGELEERRKEAERQQQRASGLQDQARRKADYETRLRQYEKYGDIAQVLVVWGAK